jgi:bifunctional oligoribonuclease and PAP phosphatase NrnA
LADLKAAFERLGTWRRTMILSHERPDGDALGGLAGMRDVIVAAGREATACVYGGLPARYEFLGASGEFTLFPRDDRPEDLDARFDGILIVDTCSWSQLETVAAYLRASRLPKIIVDHHTTRDVLAGAGGDDLYAIDATASSCCGLLYEGCVAAGWQVPTRAAEAFFAGVTTDTGWFRFPNTDGRTLRTAAGLLESGIQTDLMYCRLMESYTLQRLQLKCQMLSTLELHAEGRIAMMRLTREMFARSGAAESDTEDLVNEPLAAAAVVVSVLLGETPDGRVRVNLRSKSPEVAGRTVDVAAVARRFGGGGHARAAGARLDGSMDEAQQKVLAAVTEALRAE